MKYVALRELVNQITVGLLPSGLRRQYGFKWDPLRGAALRRRRAEVLRRCCPSDHAQTRGSSRAMTASATKFAITTRITPSSTMRLEHGDVRHVDRAADRA